MTTTPRQRCQTRNNCLMARDIQQRIEDHYEDPYHCGRSERPTHYAEANSDQCAAADSDQGSDVVAMELRIAVSPDEPEEIEEAWFEGKGCKLSQAVASMLSERIEGMRTEVVAQMSLPEMLKTLEIDVDPKQHACCRVALGAAQAALSSPCEEDLEGPTFGGPDLGDEC